MSNREPPPISKLVWQEFGQKDEKAPWSKPRGYDTSMREEADAFKSAMRNMRQREAADYRIKRNKVVPEGMQKKKRSWYMPSFDIQFKEKITRFIGAVFCIRAETDAYIQATKS